MHNKFLSVILLSIFSPCLHSKPAFNNCISKSVFLPICASTICVLNKHAERFRLRLRGGEEQSTIQTVPTREELDKALECTMCLNFLCSPRTLPCGHSFCEQCILSWLRTGQRICPLCRSNICEYGECNLCPNFALEMACRYLYGEDYFKRLKELDDLQLIPPKVAFGPIDRVFMVDRTKLPTSLVAACEEIGYWRSAFAIWRRQPR